MQLAPTAPRLLIVEDDTPLRTLFQLFLEHQGYAVQTVSTMAQAQPLLARQRFQVLLVELSSFTDLQAVVALETTREQVSPTPILLLSRWDEATEQAQQRGFRHLLEHPFPLQALVAAVEACRSVQ